MLTPTPDPTADEATDLSAASPPRGPAVPVIQRVEAHLARRFHQVCLGKLDEVTGPEELSPLEYGILGSLDDAPGIDQRRLAERMGIDPVSAHKIIGRLEGRGLVDRQVGSTDRRSRALRLTPSGLALRASLRPSVLAALAEITACLSDCERRKLQELLTRVIEANGTYARPGNGRRPPRRTKAAPSESREVRDDPHPPGEETRRKRAGDLQ